MVSGWQHIVFHSRPNGYANIFVVDVETGAYQQLTTGTNNDVATDVVTQWKWIYFCSGRNDGLQIWRMPAEGGPASQVTTNGGLVAFDSADENQLFYTKLNDTGCGFFRLTEGPSPSFCPISPAKIHLRSLQTGVYFVRTYEKEKAALSFKSFDSGRSLNLRLSARRRHGDLTVSPDGQSILYTQADHSGSDLILVDNLK